MVKPIHKAIEKPTYAIPRFTYAIPKSTYAIPRFTYAPIASTYAQIMGNIRPSARRHPYVQPVDIPMSSP